MVTGANRGIGKSIAIALAREGAKTAVHFHTDGDAADKVVEAIADEQGEAFAVQADVTDREDVRRMTAEIAAKFGPVDILVNNARQLGQKKKFLELEWADYEQQMDVIVKGAVNCCQAVLPSMIENRNGRIINMLSASLSEPDWRWHTYGAAKGALHQVSRNLAAEVGAFEITVNMVSPGLVKTERSIQHAEDYQTAYTTLTPLGRLGRAEETAETVVFLASDGASFITGANLPVSGGKVMS